MVEIVSNTQEINLKQNFPNIFHHFDPMVSSWPQKQYFLSKFYQISAFHSTKKKMKTTLKIMVKFVHNTQENI